MDEHRDQACNFGQVEMVRQGRQILLLLDNVLSHSPDLKDAFLLKLFSIQHPEYNHWIMA